MLLLIFDFALICFYCCSCLVSSFVYISLWTQC